MVICIVSLRRSKTEMAKTRIQIDIDPELIEAIKQEAESKGTNKKNYIEKIIERKAKKLLKTKNHG